MNKNVNDLEYMKRFKLLIPLLNIDFGIRYDI